MTDAVTHIWWLSKEINSDAATEADEQAHPEADNRRVLQDYSDSQKKLIETGDYNEGKRPSGWDIDPDTFENENEGAIPKNLITVSNIDSKTYFLKICREFGFEGHPARFPRQIPEFFIDFLTPNPPYEDWDQGALDRPVVLDIFAGSNLTGKVVESKGRNWLGFELEEEYLQASQFRFLTEGKIRKPLERDQTDLEEFQVDALDQ